MVNKSAGGVLNKLLTSMKKLSIEVNDQEICKKLELLISTTKEEINSNLIKNLFEDPLNFNPNDIQEPFCQYVRHFTYMIKRNKKLGINQYDSSTLLSMKEKQAAKKNVQKSVPVKKK